MSNFEKCNVMLPKSFYNSATNYFVAECGISPLTPPRHDIRIVGGRNAQFGVWAWQVKDKTSCSNIVLSHFPVASAPKAPLLKHPEWNVF